MRAAIIEVKKRAFGFYSNYFKLNLANVYLARNKACKQTESQQI